MKGIIAAVCLAGFASACNLAPLPSSPPDYIKDVAAYKEGSDGIVIYMVLADSGGQMTVAGGTVELHLVETEHYFGGSRMQERTTTLYSDLRMINPSMFERAKVGRGAFERDVVLYTFGRIPYRQFRANPSQMSGKALVKFTTESGRVLEGSESIFF